MKINQNWNAAKRVRATAVASVLLLFFGNLSQVLANPDSVGATVAVGSATFSSSGSQLTINQTSPNVFINWPSFNINPGQTTTFVQPSASSVAWNYISDTSASTINGNLNANGYIVLQNPNGFEVGGSAAISTHGLVMTTASTPNLDLSSGVWSFNAPPPTAKIVNYGQINISGGGSAFLIASDIQNMNSGSISAPGGKIGLYAGQTVLVSTSPDGRGLSAKVTLPEGSVDNAGHLIADAGKIAAMARTVNQSGLIQADSVQNVNGTIELVASDSLNVNVNSSVSAKGSSQATSTGGVTLQADNTINNNGQTIADGSSILIKAPTVNQNGTLQANSLGNINGVVEIDAVTSLQLGATSDISAEGDSTATGASPGGFVVLNAGNSFSDAAGSQINVAGGKGSGGGQSGIVEIFGAGVTTASLQSSYGNPYALLINPNDLTLSTTATSASSQNPNLRLNDLLKYSQIDLYALHNIELASLWNLPNVSVPTTLSLSAMHNITLDSGSGINAGNNWNLNLTAGTGLSSGTMPASGSDGIYLNGSSYIQTRNGDINLWAANEVLVATGIAAGNNGIRTVNGGNINVTAQDGNVNTGANPNGYAYLNTAPYYTVSSSVGGISTAAGGNVTITAGGDVTSYNPNGTSAAADGGTGAFGSQPGNVTITAGGSVYGHYVLGNGTGTIAAGRDVGVSSGANSFALSLTKGVWNVSAPNGNIYVQEVRNPNGLFNSTRPPLGSTTSPGAHLFTYDSLSEVDLSAGIGVYLTGVNVPRLSDAAILVLYPPVLSITAGSGGVTLENDVTLFPSENQNLEIATSDGGSFVSAPISPGTIPELLMSDSGQKQWISGRGYFTDQDLGTASAVEPTDLNPVLVNISGNMENLTLVTTKATEITVGGDMIGSGFSGQNLHADGPGSVTSITVGGQIYNRSPYTFLDNIHIPSVPATDLFPGMGVSWDNIFFLAMDPTKIANLVVPGNATPSDYAGLALSASLFGTAFDANGQLTVTKPAFVYDSSTARLGYRGQMSQSVLQQLTQHPTFTILQLVNGVPVTYVGTDGKTHFKTTTVSWVNPSTIAALYQDTLGAPDPVKPQLGYRIGGPGEFDINAGSIALGNTYGIVSVGTTDLQSERAYNRYNNLASITSVGADVHVTASGDINMLTSDIATLAGGTVNVESTGGSIDLGSPELGDSPTTRDIGYGVLSANGGDVNVTALGSINVNGSRIATLNGGTIRVLSREGDVNAGTGGASRTKMRLDYVDPITGLASYYVEYVFGSGILAYTVVEPEKIPNAVASPGDIEVTTPRGDILASVAGILQESLSGNVSAGPKIVLSAGTMPSGGEPGYEGNIDLGQSGVIGGEVKATANGNITGLVISRQNSDINAAQTFSGTVLAGGQADVAGGAGVVGVVIGVGGANVSGANVTAQVLGQNVSVNGGASQSTLGSSASASSASQSAAQQATQSAAEQVASNDNADAEDKKKKKKPLIRKVGRVTVILPKA